jgi:uncharacterized protein (DUF58 family)
MSGARPRPFELVPRLRFAGSPLGRRRSARRGRGDEMAGARPYRPGDLVAHIHWPASARLSAARGTDEFVVRQFYADEAPRVALALDRRRGMATRDPTLPWLDKQSAVEAVVDLVALSAFAEGADLAIADGTGAAPRWSHAAGRVRKPRGDFDAPEQSLRLSLEALLRRSPELPAGSFVFAVSDFLVPIPAETWLRLRAFGWDVVPVVVQDPMWEQSFPAVGGVVLPFVDADTGGSRDIWLSAADARRRGEENRRRLETIVTRFGHLGYDPVVVGTSDPFAISALFGRWADHRRVLRRARA